MIWFRFLFVGRHPASIMLLCSLGIRNRGLVCSCIAPSHRRWLQYTIICCGLLHTAVHNKESEVWPRLAQLRTSICQVPSCSFSRPRTCLDQPSRMISSSQTVCRSLHETRDIQESWTTTTANLKAAVNACQLPSRRPASHHLQGVM